MACEIRSIIKELPWLGYLFVRKYSLGTLCVLGCEATASFMSSRIHSPWGGGQNRASREEGDAEVAKKQGREGVCGQPGKVMFELVSNSHADGGRWQHQHHVQRYGGRSDYDQL